MIELKDLDGKTAEELITQYCHDLDHNLLWLLGFLVALWFVKYGFGMYIKRRYTKKNLPTPPKIQWYFELIAETVDLLQSSYILVVFVLMLLY
jgi:hypothetical protein